MGHLRAPSWPSLGEPGKWSDARRDEPQRALIFKGGGKPLSTAFIPKRVPRVMREVGAPIWAPPGLLVRRGRTAAGAEREREVLKDKLPFFPLLFKVGGESHKEEEPGVSRRAFEHLKWPTGLWGTSLCHWIPSYSQTPIRVQMGESLPGAGVLGRRSGAL